jgi:pentatricopeptide repeat domain-containing protein 1
MVKRKVEVNEFTYGALLEACIKNKNLQKAREVYERMLQDKRITMNTILYSTVLKMLNLDRRLKQSKLVYQTMCEKRETYPNNFS